MFLIRAKVRRGGVGQGTTGDINQYVPKVLLTKVILIFHIIINKFV